jgi:hypothetical protein
METGHFLKDPTGARQYLETLIRDHLGAIIKDFKFEQPPSRERYITYIFFSKMNIKAHSHRQLEGRIQEHSKNADVILALLIEAAINIENDTKNRGNKPAYKFLEQVVSTQFYGGALKAIEFQYAILRGLLQKGHQKDGSAWAMRNSTIR